MVDVKLVNDVISNLKGTKNMYMKMQGDRFNNLYAPLLP